MPTGESSPITGSPAEELLESLAGGIISLTVAGCVGTVRAVKSKPIIAAAGALTTTDVLVLGQQGTTYSLAALAASPLVWAAVHRRSFRAIGVSAARAYYRRVSVYNPGWHKAMQGCGLAKRHETVMEVPKIKTVACDEFFDYVTVKLLPGQSRPIVQKAAEELAATFGSEVCRIRKVKHKRFGMGRGTHVRLDFRRRDALAEIVQPIPTPVPEEVNLDSVTVGLTEYGKPWLLELLGTHILIGGATGSGKASVLWSLMRGIAPAIHDGTVEVWGFDPKDGMELTWGKKMFRIYMGEGCEIKDMADKLSELVAIMEERSERLAGKTRKHEPTLDDPLIICVIDELADLTLCSDKALRKLIIEYIEKLLRRARSVGIVLVMALQDVAKDAIPFRGLIPHGIALRLKEQFEVDAILGPGAYTSGAACLNIAGAPGAGSTEDGRGIAYMTRLGETEPLRVRASYVTDEDIIAMAEMYPAYDRASSTVDFDALEQEFADSPDDEERPASKP